MSSVSALMTVLVLVLVSSGCGEGKAGGSGEDSAEEREVLRKLDNYAAAINSHDPVGVCAALLPSEIQSDYEQCQAWARAEMRSDGIFAKPLDVQARQVEIRGDRGHVELAGGGFFDLVREGEGWYISLER